MLQDEWDWQQPRIGIGDKNKRDDYGNAALGATVWGEGRVCVCVYI